MRAGIWAAAAAAVFSGPLPAQLDGNSPALIEKYTPLNPFPRSADGRPAIPEYWIERLREVSTSTADRVLREHGYCCQFEGGFHNTRPEKRLAGRAFTVGFLPARPDVERVAEGDAKTRGGHSHPTIRVIEMLTSGDVLVADILGRIEKGQFGGDNLIFGIFLNSGRGFVVDGSFRDLDGVAEHRFPVLSRGQHPGVRGDATLAWVNRPARIGRATAMPGDAVLADRTGVVFIPPHLVRAVVEAHAGERP